MNEPFEVIIPIPAAGHKIVAQEVIEPIGIELTGKHVAEKRTRADVLQEICRARGQAAVHRSKNLMHFGGWNDNDAASQLFMLDPADALEDMAERAMPQVVQQRRRQA